ncbi:MAG: oligosaccharide flippase family protein [Ignavibacteria bacterium]
MIDKIKSLSKDTLIYGTNTIIGRSIYFFLIPFYTNIFLPAEYGIVAILYSYIAILNVFFSIGLESGYMKFASAKEVGTQKQNFSNPFLLVLFNSFFLCAVIYILSSHLTGLFQIDEKYSDLIKYSALILFFDTLILIPFAYLRLHNKAKTFAGIKITNMVINVMMNIILIKFYHFGIEAVFISNLIASVVTLIMMMPVILRNINFSFNKELVSELMRFSLPYIPAGIAANIVQIIDRPILKYLTNDATVGIYQANYRLGIFMMLVVSMFEFAWRPFFLNNAKDPDAKKIFSKVLTIFVFVSSFIFIVITVFINDIVKLNIPNVGYLLGEKYWAGLSIVPVILFAYMLNGMYVNFMAGIYIEKKTKHLPWITGLGAVSNVIANFILIPEYSYMGAAIATLISYLVMMLGIYFISNKYYPIQYDYKRIGMIFLFLAVITFLFYYAVHTLNPAWYFKLIFPLAFISLILFFKIISISSLRQNLKSKI